MKFECPSCNQHLEADDELVGQSVQCPSCNYSVVIPALGISEPASAPPPRPQPEAAKSSATAGGNSQVQEDKEKLAGLRGALLVMPLYMLSLLFLLFTLWQATGMKANPAVAKAGFAALIVMIGISARSWQCLTWIRTDPHRASAIGKKLFLLFIVLSCIDTLIAEWPSDKFEGPMSALSTEQVSYGYYDQKQLYVVDPNETQVIEAGFWAWLSFVFTFASDFLIQWPMDRSAWRCP